MVAGYHHFGKPHIHIFIGIAMGIFAGTRSSSLTGQAAGFLQRLGQTFRDVLVWRLVVVVMGHLPCDGKMLNECTREVGINIQQKTKVF